MKTVRTMKTIYTLFLLSGIAFFSGHVHAQNSFINSNFNGTPIPQGRIIWFNCHIKLASIPPASVGDFSVSINASQVTFTVSGVGYNVSVPKAKVTFSTTATAASTTYTNGSGWNTIIPYSQRSNSEIFLSGVPLTLTTDFPGGITPVQWHLNLTSSTPGVSVQWQWSASVFTNFANSSQLANAGVQLYGTSKHAGAPLNYADALVGGARGGGGANLTGSWSSTASIVAPSLGSIASYVWTDINNNGKRDEPAVQGLNGQTVELWTPGTDGIKGNGDDIFVASSVTYYDANDNPGYYLFQSLSSGTYYVKYSSSVQGYKLTQANVYDLYYDNSAIDPATNTTPLITINTSSGGQAKDFTKANVGLITAANNIVLAVALKSFTAVRNKQTVEVNWSTATEQNNKGFYVQRAINGEWKNIALIFSKAADGNSSTELQYQYSDMNSSKGVSQYRIQQVGLDGATALSAIRSVAGEKMSNTAVIYPNPSKGVVNILLGNDASYDITVFDLAGRIVKQLKNSNDGVVQLSLLQKGIYTVKITDGNSGEASFQKVVID